jgi:hypothetical protein
MMYRREKSLDLAGNRTRSFSPVSTPTGKAKGKVISVQTLEAFRVPGSIPGATTFS